MTIIAKYKQETHYTKWKGSKYGVFSGPYLPLFGLNTGKSGPEKTPNLDTFHAVLHFLKFKMKIPLVVDDCP